MASLSEALKPFAAVILTGGSSGIGKSFIELAAEIRPDLLICNLSRRAPAMNSPQLKLRHIPCDLRRRDQIEAAVGGVLNFLNAEQPRGQVLLINNSGIGSLGCFLERDFAHETELVDVNIRAVVELTGRLLPLLRERGGAVMNIASTAAFQPTPLMSTYGATKVFLLHWGLALRTELKPLGLRVVTICPGPTATEFGARAGLPEGALVGVHSQTAKQVATEALLGLAKDRAIVVCGAKNRWVARFARHAPKRLATWLAARVISSATGLPRPT